MSNEELIKRLLSAVDNTFIHYDEPNDEDYCVKCEVLTLITEVYANA
jgi:hypothetical protein